MALDTRRTTRNNRHLKAIFYFMLTCAAIEISVAIIGGVLWRLK